MPVRSTRVVVCVLAVVALITPLVFFSSGFFSSTSEKVLPGVEVMGIELGNLNKPEGAAKLSELEKSLRAAKVTLCYQDQRWPLLLNEAGFELDEEAVMDAALQAGRKGSLIQQWRDRKQLKQSGMIISPAVGFDQDRLSQRVKELTRGITVDPVDANFIIDANDAVSVRPAKDGTIIDMEKLTVDLTSAIVESQKPEVEMAMITVPPARSTEMVQSMGINGLLAGYTTWFDPAKVSRTYNISVAAHAFDEQLIRPGHEVSFNKVVGPRSSETGYKTAPIIVNNEFVDGVGGGVCQVSTTLYNCVLLAGLEIVERSNHSLPVTYVPIGRDATVVYDEIDFRFRNNTESYIFIKSFVSGGQIGLKIYGNTAYKKDVRVSSWVTQEIEPGVVYENDPNLLKGEQVVKQEGQKGFKASAERVFFSNGAVEKREYLSSSEYSPVNKVIAVGTLEQALPQIAPSTPSPGAGGANKPAGGRNVQSNTNQNMGGVNGGNNSGTESSVNQTVNQAIPALKPSANQ
ncbi:VanW family protein [Pelotomaculum terephthalicicum JT]|uniref:VanW family protein n=1 Tax=Pelotomaculum TaxID=191373 RepID=UPI0009D03AA4|nr:MULTISPECIES: VanW family protein [Pelotomaculum]MCG9969082.1 VanW family protein [Pelotomaculum terephthalicicum JT]OPX87398.1 MAG: Vancomycin B-type resistance protein VanW [Pelotomaculum sp. PtaB.Bin117]OPY60907.1 MAG: Vancomycin B-type resistance protein VanW [Pelotomaculum sp. PtaU1.Bin065]